MDSVALPATWQDAFQNQSVSSIRTAEKQLRGSVLRDREKLRALVGNNYRELLSTAEKIVTVADQTRAAESDISNLSQACKPKNVDDQNHAPLANVAKAAQLKFLDSILRCTSKATKGRRLVLASKLLVISRLLLKHLEDARIGVSTIQWFQSRLKVTRQQLVVAIDATLIQPAASAQTLAQAIVAYCLVTSSPSVDALKHFQDIRAQRIAEALPLDKSGKLAGQLLKAKCYYLITTVIVLRTLSGRIVNDLLNDLQKRPIVESEDIIGLETLQLDLHRSLLPTDIVVFAPYFKRATLTSSELRSNAQAWVNSTFDSISTSLESLIANFKLSLVLRMRYEILDILLPSCFSAFLYESALEKFRAVFNKRIVQLVENQAKAVESVSEKALENQNINTPEIFWRSRGVQPDKSRLADVYIQKLRKHHLGIYDELQVSIRGLQKWASGCGSIKRELQDMGKTRWRDKLEDFDDDNDEEAQALVSDLSKNDADLYSARFSAALQDTCGTLVIRFAASASKTTSDTSSGLETSNITSLLRLGREVDVILNSLFDDYDAAELNQTVLQLQHTLAQRTSAEFFGISEISEPTISRMYSTDDLPSPMTMFALRNLSSVMLKNGGIDLWTPNVCAEVRRLVFKRITSTEHREYYTNSEFDMCYVTAALGQEHSTAPDSVNDDKPVNEKTGANGAASRDVVNLKAIAYWKRTRALFGIFAPP